MAPGSTLNVIVDGHINKKFQLEVPPRIYNFPDISCKNTACISHPSNMQHEVSAYFIRVDSLVKGDSSDHKELRSQASFACKYCEQVHSFAQIWDYKSYPCMALAPKRSEL